MEREHKGDTMNTETRSPILQALRTGRLHTIARWVRDHTRMAARVRGDSVEVAQAFRTPQGADALRFEEVRTMEEAQALVILGPGGDFTREVRP